MCSQQPDSASSNSAPRKFKFSYLFLFLASILLVVLIAPPSVFASGIIVNTFADELIAGDGDCSLREAVINANSDMDLTGGDCVAGSGADTIQLQAGTYVLTLPAGGNDPKSGDLDLASELTIIGMGATNTTVDASGVNDRAFEIAGIATISNLTVTGGSNDVKGGGILVLDGAQLVLDYSHVRGNVSKLGGGIANLGGSVVLDHSQVSENFATIAGGGVYNAEDGQMTILHTAVLNNQAGPNRRVSSKFGGGVNNSEGATLTIENSTISGNTAADDGGGIYNHTAHLSLTNVTIVENHAFSEAGAIDNFGWAEFVNAIIVGNTAKESAPDCRSLYGWPLTNQGNNLLRHDSSCPSNPADQTINVNDLFVTVLAPLGDYGGATPTYELLEDSPALDNANDAFCPDDDQRGLARPQGDACDIGAYELEVDISQTGPIFIVNVADDIDDGVCDLEHCSLREAILAANGNEGKDTIIFDLEAMGSDVIAPDSPLPEVTDPVEIDGFGFYEEASGATAVTIDGDNAGEGANGFVLGADAGDSGIFSLTITNFKGNGIVVLESSGNTIQNNQIFNNGALGIDLNEDGVTSNDKIDADTGANDNQNFPYIVRAVPGDGTTFVEGTFHSTPDATFYLEFYLNQSCDPTGFGEGQQLLGSSVVTTDTYGNADIAAELSTALPLGSLITATATNEAGSTSEFSQCAFVSLGNDSWPRAYRLPLTQDSVDTNVFTGDITQFLDQVDQSRWYKLQVQPNSQMIVTLTDLPANYDLTVYKDIAQAFSDLTMLNDEDDLTQLTAEFAPDAFSPDAFSPDAFSPDAFSPDAFSPDAFSPDAFSPDAFSSAQTRSLIAVSAFEGNASEGIRINTWENTGDFYIRVRGRNGVFNPTQSFNLHVELMTGQCADVDPLLPATTLTLPPNSGDFKTIILTDKDRMEGSDTEKATLQTQLEALAAQSEVAGVVVDVSTDTTVFDANVQADNFPACPFAKNLVARSVKQVVDLYWDDNPLQYVVVVGNDNVIPFFRHPDQALLANERNYAPPVLDNTASQASLKLGYVLSQDAYGARTQINRGVSKIPVPLLSVGRLVETAAEATGVVNAYLSSATDGVVDTPTSSLVSGYDFLTDAAEAVSQELEAGIGVPPAELIADRGVSPEEVRPYPDDPAIPNFDTLSWTADHLRDELFGSNHDLIFLAAHFSAGSMLAADYESRLLATEVADSSLDLTNVIIFSAGCHAGYNLVKAHEVPGVSPDPDWAQAVAQKFGTLVAGTGYQYGDTDLIEYSERLYLDFSKELRAGTGPVSIGDAMVRAKQSYLANTSELRPIHEKALLEATIFGLPMLSVNMPQGRGGSTSTPANIVPSAVTSNPGAILNLHVADLNVAPSLTPTSVELDVVGGEEGETVTATYLDGGDKTLTNPAELVLPVLVEDVTATDFVLRGVGFTGGSYTDLPGLLPLTGAPTTEIRGVHAPFLTSVYYPIQLTQANYFDVLAQGFGNGRTTLSITPAQFLSDGPASSTGTIRQYTSLNYKLFYSDFFATTEMGNTPAQAASPTFSVVQVRVVGSDVQVRARVFGDPSAGMQEVWATITGLTGSYHGQWQSVMLEQSDEADSTVWTGSFPLNGTPYQDIRVMLQAVNGVGLVSMATNLGKYYIPTVDGLPSDPDPAATSLQFVAPPTSGEYGGTATVSAQLTAEDGELVAGQLIQFALGSQQRTAVTNASGIATAEIRLLGLIGTDQLKAAFAGNDDYQSSFTTNPFTITPQSTNLTLDPVDASAYDDETVQIMATLTGLNGIPLTQKTVIFVITGGEEPLVVSEITDNTGRAYLQVNLPVGTYNVDASFASVVQVDGGTLDLTDDRYEPTSASGSITVEERPDVILYMSSSHGGSISGIDFETQDILAYNITTDEWSLFFDGSDVGLFFKDIDAFAILDDGSLLLSLETPTNIDDFDSVDDSDILRFVPTSLGEETAGTYEWYFVGADVGLTKGEENIDGLTVLADGRLLISTAGDALVNGTDVRDEDMLIFTPTSLGTSTSGQWDFFFDGSDIGLTRNTEDIDGISVNQATGDIYFSTLDAFKVDGLVGNGADVVTCTPNSLGKNTSCELSLFWQSVLHYAQWIPVNAIHIEQ